MNTATNCETGKEPTIVDLLRLTKDTLLETKEILDGVDSLIHPRSPRDLDKRDVQCMLDEVIAIMDLVRYNRDVALEIKEALG